MNRGSGRHDIFDHAGNARQFLHLVGESSELFHVEVHAYCLMPNHYHLLVRSVDGQLSRFMQRISSNYTRSLNQDRSSDGPLFRGRFHSLLCSTTTHVDNAWRYIHRNPLDVQPDSPLDDWQWSSYRYYTGRAARPSWLTTSVWFGWHGSRAALRRFVESESAHDDAAVPDRWHWAVQTAIAEFDLCGDGPVTPRMSRTVMSAAATLCDGPVAHSLLESLKFANEQSRNRAVRRATERMFERPELEAVVRRAAHLAR